MERPIKGLGIGGKLYRCNISGRIIPAGGTCFHTTSEILSPPPPHFTEFTLAEYLGVVEQTPAAPAPDPELVRQYLTRLELMNEDWTPLLFRHTLLAAKAWLEEHERRCPWTYRGERCWYARHDDHGHESDNHAWLSTSKGAKCLT